MSGHLCLKWNNHSSAFLKSFSNIQSKGRFCDATIVCQGRYFPVHRIILSTCSDYFEEIFERIQCQHPYVVFKDIEPREMELLLNYMYQGEVNVIQEMLPMLIKAAESLRVKGLAVPDDMPSSKDSSGKKRSNSTDDDPQPKRRLEEKRRRKDATDFGINSQSETSAKEERLTRNMEGKDSENIATLHSAGQLKNETFIKQEPLESCKFSDDILPIHGSVPSLPNESQLSKKDDGIFVNFPVADDSSSCIKKEEIVSTDESFEEKAPSWTDSDTAIFMQNLPHTTVDKQDGCSTWDNNVSNNSNAGTVKGECSTWDNNVGNNSNAGTVKGECSTWDNNVGNNSNAGTVKGECSTWDNNVSNNSNAGTVKGECSTWDNNASNNSNAGTVQGERSTWDDNVNNNSNAATVQGESYEINLGLKSVMDSQNEYFAAPFQVVREEGSDFSSEHNNFKSTSQCHFCSYKTTNKYRLERHTMFKHKGYRPFPCPVCPLRCTLRTDLERHMLIHTGEKPFECPKCKFKFRRKSHLKKHLDKSHCKQQSCEERQNALNLTL